MLGYTFKPTSKILSNKTVTNSLWLRLDAKIIKIKKLKTKSNYQSFYTECAILIKKIESVLVNWKQKRKIIDCFYIIYRPWYGTYVIFKNIQKKCN